MRWSVKREPSRKGAAVHGGGAGGGVWCREGAAVEIFINHFTGTRKPISLLEQRT